MFSNSSNKSTVSAWLSRAIGFGSSTSEMASLTAGAEASATAAMAVSSDDATTPTTTIITGSTATEVSDDDDDSTVIGSSLLVEDATTTTETADPSSTAAAGEAANVVVTQTTTSPHGNHRQRRPQRHQRAPTRWSRRVRGLDPLPYDSSSGLPVRRSRRIQNVCAEEVEILDVVLDRHRKRQRERRSKSPSYRRLRRRRLQRRGVQFIDSLVSGEKTVPVTDDDVASRAYDGSSDAYIAMMRKNLKDTQNRVNILFHCRLRWKENMNTVHQQMIDNYQPAETNVDCLWEPWMMDTHHSAEGLGIAQKEQRIYFEELKAKDWRQEVVQRWYTHYNV
jgi:hypothetical protein